PRLANVVATANGEGAGAPTIINPAGGGLTATTVQQVCNDGAGGATRIITATSAACTSNNVVGYVAVNSNARFVQAGLGALANAGRDTVNTPGLNIWNMSLFKTMKFTERTAVQFPFPTFDNFNHQNYSICLTD